MKAQFFTFLLAGSILSFCASAQSVKENIDKAAKDKSTAERSAKADVLIQKRTRVITNSSSEKSASISASDAPASQSQVKEKRHHKHWKKKRKSFYK